MPPFDSGAYALGLRGQGRHTNKNPGTQAGVLNSQLSILINRRRGRDRGGAS